MVAKGLNAIWWLLISLNVLIYAMIGSNDFMIMVFKAILPVLEWLEI
ncbi:hypothetical protein Aeh1hmmORF02c [Aeromonas phage Aeh1]|uniref:Uncharacterized protein n=1 Tax=Aeromonas phage Aeh1 TaxID=2880362 RepID=Q76YV7_9CAUD|nr:hypothetical protein Aeh1p134 [Aeromonas phage Aeh1]AAQ17789.1 hypothetical protein Aeh1hmmORF02c [Aeromonas phage Aeh1]